MKTWQRVLSIVVGLVLIAASVLEFLGVHLGGPHEPRPHWMVAAVGVAGLALCFPETVATWWRRWREYRRGGAS
jgi:Zn-dependent protease with chaperone function